MKSTHSHPTHLFQRSLCTRAFRIADVTADDPLKRKMASWYSEYSKTYDRDGYHTRMANRLVKGVEIHEGDRILDVATGTGLAGFAALQRAGEKGSLVAVDISPEMLNVAMQAAELKGLKNADFVLSDGQKLDLDEESFDVFICSSALVLFPNEKWTLTYWKRFLVPGGRLAVHCFSEESYIRGKLIQKAAAEFGIELIFSEPTGTVKKCRQLLHDCGYTSIVVDEVEDGSYVPLTSILDAWDKMIRHPMIQLHSLVPDEDTLHQIKERYVQMARDLETEQGLWDDDTVMYVFGRKPLTE